MASTAVEQEIEAIIHNIAEEIHLDLIHEVPSRIMNKNTVSLEIINEVMKDMIADECMPLDMRESVGNLKGEDLLPILVYLQDCLVPRTTFKNNAKEKAWSNYYRAYLDNMQAVTQVTKLPGVSAWLCFSVFEHLIKLSYNTNEQTTSPVNLTKKEEDIVHYIGGSVISKLQKLLHRMKVSPEREEQLSCLRTLTQNDQSAVEGSLTNVLDRGGLIVLKENINQMFIALEGTFLSMYGDNHQTDLSSSAFVKKCVATDSIMCSFYEHMYNVEVTNEKKFCIFVKIVQLYFKIRAHHKCKCLMDKHRYKARQSQKQKSLRKSLKSKPM